MEKQIGYKLDQLVTTLNGALETLRRQNSWPLRKFADLDNTAAYRSYAELHVLFLFRTKINFELCKHQGVKN